MVLTSYATVRWYHCDAFAGRLYMVLSNVKLLETGLVIMEGFIPEKVIRQPREVVESLSLAVFRTL